LPKQPLRILVGHLSSAAGGNLDLRLLYDVIGRSGNVVAQPYSSSAVLSERWDVIHVYWPEWCIERARGAVVTGADALRFLTELKIAKARGAKLVWTLNNLRPHESDSLGLVDTFVHVFSHLVDAVVCSSQTLLEEFVMEYPAIRNARSSVIRPGHVRGVYPDDGLTRTVAREHLSIPSEPKVMLALGMVRPYKNLTTLARCFREAAEGLDDSLLIIAGKALDDGYAERLRRECRGVGSVRTELRYIEESEMQYFLRAADVMAVPTLLPVNSGSAMLALSFGCPVFAPHRGTFVEMREEIGPDWVRTYSGGLRSTVVRDALAQEAPEGLPPLDGYSWEIAGQEYHRLFDELAAAGDRGRSGG
jgi:glycosyltransferase involved in cell wall biosynthesis